MSFINVKASFGKAEHQVDVRFSIPKHQLTCWELQESQGQLLDPEVGRVLDIGIMNFYFEVKVVVESVTFQPQHSLIYRTLQSIGEDGMVHNFGYQTDTPVLFSFLQTMV